MGSRRSLRFPKAAQQPHGSLATGSQNEAERELQQTLHADPKNTQALATLAVDAKAASRDTSSRRRQKNSRSTANRSARLRSSTRHPIRSVSWPARQQGNVSLQLGGSGTVNLIIKSYIKPNDQVTLTINDQTKTIIAGQIQSYLNDPSDAVTISAQFAQLPDGTNHVASMTINGQSRQLTVNEQNANYQKT